MDVCPVDCIHGPIDITGAGAEVEELREKGELEGKQLYINPEECIDCGACLPECPVEAIYDDEEQAIEYDEKDAVQKNYAFFHIDLPSTHMNNREIDKMMSRICELQLYLTQKIIRKRNTEYRPIEGDEDQPLRDELLKLRKKIGIIK